MSTAPPLDTVREVLTPEGVVLRLQVAGPFPRALAWLIDACVRMTVLAMFGGVAFDLLGQVGMAMVLVVVFVLTWFYPVMFEVLWNGQTIGKRVLGIRVVAADGAPVGWMGAFVRNLLRAVDMLPTLYAAGLLAGLFDPWGRRLGDLVAGTLVVHVIHAPPAGMIEPVPAQPPALALEAEEQRAVIAFAERARTLPPERCRELAELARPLSGQTGDAGVKALFGTANWLLGSAPVSVTPAPGSVSVRGKA